MDEEAAKQLIARMESAWNSADHDAFAELFSPDAVFVNVNGGYRAGREGIRAGHKRTIHVTYHDSEIEDHLELYQPLPDGKALILASGLMRYKDTGELIHRSRRTMVIESVADGVQIIWFHNTIITKNSRDEVASKASAVYDPLA
jgi:uncharacterized protein (TIGR02246 family)